MTLLGRGNSPMSGYNPGSIKSRLWVVRVTTIKQLQSNNNDWARSNCHGDKVGRYKAWPV